MFNLLKQRSQANKEQREEKNEVIPKRLGLRYDPCAIILEYLEPQSGKLYHHKMRMGKIKESEGAREIYERLEKRHRKYLGNIQESQMINLINKVLNKKKKTAPSIDGKQFYAQYKDKDLNKLDEEELKKEKQKMDQVFNQNFKKPGDAGYQYDVQKDFDPYEDNEWDEEEEDDEIDEYL